MFSSNLFSHPNKILDEHLINVANLIEFFLRDKPESIQKKLLPVAKIAGFTHDLGKATRSFQDYITSKSNENAKKTQHTKFSAVCSYYICKTQTEDDLLSFFCYVSVRRHHSNLKSILEETQIFDEEEKEFLLKQLEEIDDRSFNILAENLYKKGLPVLLNKKLIEQWINDFPNELKPIKRQLRKTSNIENYITLNLLYSLLLDADKSEVVIGDLKAFERRNYNEENWVKNYLSKMNYSDSFINQLRKQAFEEVDSYNIDLNQKLYLINIPT
ncbi:MAG: CRISPR-associated endonuclease Cas3'', partial [Leptonema sp. (in: bacteria)]